LEKRKSRELSLGKEKKGRVKGDTGRIGEGYGKRQGMGG
jgi:hypothetical protein